METIFLDFVGIMAVLFAGILMSHYTHCNLSPVTQMTVQQTFRSVAFMAETLVFAYLGLSIFSMSHHISISFVLWAIVSKTASTRLFVTSFTLTRSNYLDKFKIKTLTNTCQCYPQCKLMRSI